MLLQMLINGGLKVVGQATNNGGKIIIIKAMLQ